MGTKFSVSPKRKGVGVANPNSRAMNEDGRALIVSRHST